MMDRVLSYQTAVRAGSHDTSGFDIRQYISKRTCISMTMSIAFIALIFGFLLGKFTSDRNHIIKEKRPTTHRPIMMENEVERVIHSVIDAARIKQLTNYKDQYSKEEDDIATRNQMSFFHANFTSCLSESNHEDLNFENLEEFFKDLLRNYHNVYLMCARELRNILLLND